MRHPSALFISLALAIGQPLPATAAAPSATAPAADRPESVDVPLEVLTDKIQGECWGRFWAILTVCLTR